MQAEAARTGLITGGGKPTAHFSGQTKTIHNIQHFRHVHPIGRFVHRKRLLLQIGPHHLQIQTLPPHLLKVVSRPPALA